MSSIILKTAADCAFAAYQKSALGPTYLLDRVDLFENKDTHTEGFVGSTGSLVVVAFAGTADIHDWMTNIRCSLTTVELPGGYAVRLHTGFYEAYLSVAVRVQVLIHKHMGGKIRRILFTGHSLGGALAVNAALECKAQDVAYRIITFGAPRVGGWCLQALLAPYCTRVVARGDKVPRLPFAWVPWRPWASYWPVGKAIKRGIYLPGVCKPHSMGRYRELVWQMHGLSKG